MKKELTLNRYSENTGTCFGKNFKSVSYGFFSQFQDSFFYANVIQFLIVAFLYLNVGNGRYWHLLLIASTAGFFGALLENGTVAYLCQKDNRDTDIPTIVIPFLIDEFFWTSCQYSVPFLNLIKMKAFAVGKLANIVRYTIIGLFVPFLFFRFFIGFERMIKGYLVDEKISSLHGYAFGVLAIADVICTISILYFVRKHNNELSYSTSNISEYIKNSSYTTLIAVDIVGFSLSILDIITNSGVVEDYVPSTITVPFQCLMSNFILILSVDALILKYGGNNPHKGSTTFNCKSMNKNKNDINDEVNSTTSSSYVVYC